MIERLLSKIEYLLLADGGLTRFFKSLVILGVAFIFLFGITVLVSNYIPNIYQVAAYGLSGGNIGVSLQEIFIIVLLGLSYLGTAIITVASIATIFEVYK